MSVLSEESPYHESPTKSIRASTMSWSSKGSSLQPETPTENAAAVMEDFIEQAGVVFP